MVENGVALKETQLVAQKQSNVVGAILMVCGLCGVEYD